MPTSDSCTRFRWATNRYMWLELTTVKLNNVLQIRILIYTRMILNVYFCWIIFLNVFKISLVTLIKIMAHFSSAHLLPFLLADNQSFYRYFGCNNKKIEVLFNLPLRPVTRCPSGPSSCSWPGLAAMSQSWRRPRCPQTSCSWRRSSRFVSQSPLTLYVSLSRSHILPILF